MKFDLIVNAPLEPRVFRAVTVINGVPCISVTKLDPHNTEFFLRRCNPRQPSNNKERHSLRRI